MKRGSKDNSLDLRVLVKSQAINTTPIIKIIYRDMPREKSMLIIVLWTNQFLPSASYPAEKQPAV